MTAVLVAALLVLAAAAEPFQVTPPAVVIDIDGGEVHGTPIQLGWSPDSESWYLETLDGQGPSAQHHYFLIALGDKAPRTVKELPQWAAEYWSFKSNRAVPDHPQMLIEVEETKRTNQVPNQSLAQKAGGASNGGMAMQGAVNQSNDYANAARVQTLTVDGTTISKLVDEPLIPGMTFGWSPEKLDAVAFRNEKHHGLSLYRIKGGTMNVDDTKEVLLPAWSPDGTKIVFLEQTGKKKYELRQLKVTLP